MGLFGFRNKKSDEIKESFEENLIKYLNEKNMYDNPVQLLLPETVKILGLEGEWGEILSLNSRQERVNRTIMFWEKKAESFKIVIDLFKEKLLSVDTILYNKEIAIIYSLRVKTGLLYYIGFLPTKDFDNELLKSLPHEISDFYTSLHDGFTLYATNIMGLSSLKEVYCLADDLTQEEFLQDYSVEKSYMLFSNGSGDGIVYDISKTPAKGFTYFHDDYEHCDFKHSSIDVMCNWIQIVLTEDY